MASTSSEYAAYVRRQITADDIAFQRGNRAWNNERPGHLLECLGFSVKLLTQQRFVVFHASYAEEFQRICTDLESAAEHDQAWFDQTDHIDEMLDLLRDVTEMIERILDAVQEV